MHVRDGIGQRGQAKGIQLLGECECYRLCVRLQWQMLAVLLGGTQGQDRERGLPSHEVGGAGLGGHGTFFFFARVVYGRKPSTFAA